MGSAFARGPLVAVREFCLKYERERGERESSSAPVGFFGSRKICRGRVRDDLDVHLI